MNKHKSNATTDNFDKLVKLMHQLRSPEGCPWDRAQTHDSLKKYMLEEAYEVLEAIDAGSDDDFRDELGDLLMQVIFHAQLAQERKAFDIQDVIRAITDKMIRRHPNVFGDEKIDTAEQQAVNWEKIKKTEGKRSVLDGVPTALCALLRAARVQQKAATVGFEWATIEPVWGKVNEELIELQEAKSKSEMEDEFGDVLFALVNLSRFMQIEAEDALHKSINKFKARFTKVESHFKRQGKNMSELSLQEMDDVWEKIKAERTE